MYPTEMNREQRLFLVNLNNRLSEIEKQLKKESLEIIKTMNKRLEDDADWINDYGIKCTVEFYLNENDPEYSDEEDNLQAEFDECVGLLRYADHSILDDEDNLQAEFDECVGLLRYADHSLLASDKNWNDTSIADMDNPDQLEHHGWFYHQLYDHARLSWDNMLRIGDIWVDINITLQHHLKLS